MLGFLDPPTRLLGSLARAVGRRGRTPEDPPPEVAVPLRYAESMPPVPDSPEPRDAIRHEQQTRARGRSTGELYPLPTPITRSLPPEPVSVTEARSALAPLEAALTREGFQTLSLLVSELVSNSVLHGAGDRSDGIELEVRASPQKVRAVVADAGPRFGSFTRTARDDHEGGWGLHLVDALSQRWGIDRDGDTRVWFELEEVAS